MKIPPPPKNYKGALGNLSQNKKYISDDFSILKSTKLYSEVGNIVFINLHF